MKVHLAHILVEQKFEAEDLLRKMKDGADFKVLAERYSRCSSARAGGDLGTVDERRLDNDFSEQAKGLQVGQISGIVRTRFGYHIIKKLSEDKL